MRHWHSPLIAIALITLPPFLLGQSSLSSHPQKAKEPPKISSVSAASAQTVTVHVGPGGTLTFNPSTVNITVGDTVQWTWDSNNHSATSGNCCTADNKFCSPNDLNCPTAALSNTGATYSHAFTQAGTFPYFCRAHGGAGMVGTINVVPPLQITGVSRPSTGASTGHFIITGQTAPNLTVSIHASPNLITSFTLLDTTTANGTGVFQYDDATAATIQPPMRFYKVSYP